jgi:hypothetical protein
MVGAALDISTTTLYGYLIKYDKRQLCCNLEGIFVV